MDEITVDRILFGVRMTDREADSMEFGFVFQDCPCCGTSCVEKGYRMAFMTSPTSENPGTTQHGVHHVWWCPCGAIVAYTFDSQTIVLLSSDDHEKLAKSSR